MHTAASLQTLKNLSTETDRCAAAFELAALPGVVLRGERQQHKPSQVSIMSTSISAQQESSATLQTAGELGTL